MHNQIEKKAKIFQWKKKTKKYKGTLFLPQNFLPLPFWNSKQHQQQQQIIQHGKNISPLFTPTTRRLQFSRFFLFRAQYQYFFQYITTTLILTLRFSPNDKKLANDKQWWFNFIYQKKSGNSNVIAIWFFKDKCISYCLFGERKSNSSYDKGFVYGW